MLLNALGCFIRVGASRAGRYDNNKLLRREGISHFRIEQKTGSSRLFGGTKINNMPNMASRKFSYIPKVLCAA